MPHPRRPESPTENKYYQVEISGNEGRPQRNFVGLGWVALGIRWVGSGRVGLGWVGVGWVFPPTHTVVDDGYKYPPARERSESYSILPLQYMKYKKQEKGGED